MDDRLFLPSTTHIEVRCWKCGHTAEFRRGQLPEGLTEPVFTKRAKCRCGAGWPAVTRYPKPKKRSSM